MSEQLIDNNLISKDGDTINYDEKVEQLVNEGYSFDIGNYISQGFDIFKQNIGGFIGYTLLVAAISVFGQLIPVIGALAVSVISPALTVGYFIVGKKILFNEDYEFGDFFKGFQFLLHLFLGNLVGGIFIIIGIILLVVPGIYLGVAYIWVSLFIVFAGKEFWPAMEMSRKVITKNWLSFLGFAIVLGLINILGLICLGIGILVTIPATILAVFVAFKEVVGINENQHFN